MIIIIINFTTLLINFTSAQTYYPAFKSCVVAGGASIMCSYNAVNGVPSCANDLINNQIVRREWGFEGYIVSTQTELILIIIMHNFCMNYWYLGQWLWSSQWYNEQPPVSAALIYTCWLSLNNTQLHIIIHTATLKQSKTQSGRGSEVGVT